MAMWKICKKAMSKRFWKDAQTPEQKFEKKEEEVEVLDFEELVNNPNIVSRRSWKADGNQSATASLQMPEKRVRKISRVLDIDDGGNYEGFLCGAMSPNRGTRTTKAIHVAGFHRESTDSVRLSSSYDKFWSDEDLEIRRASIKRGMDIL